MMVRAMPATIQEKQGILLKQDIFGKKIIIL